MTPAYKRPRRERKGDRLLNPGASAQEIECDYAMAPMDGTAREMDAKWGIDRLPELVTPELAARYGQAIAHLNEMIASNDPAAVAAAAGNCQRGLIAMDAEALRLGHQPNTGEFLEYELTQNGKPPFRFAVLKDGAQWQAIKKARPDLEIYSMAEVAVALLHHLKHPMIAEVKDKFPGATVTAIRLKTKLEEQLNDHIPF